MPPASAPYVLIFDPAASSGNWLLEHLEQIHISARWVTTPAELLAAAEERSPVVCLFALRAPITQALELLADLIQEPRFAHTAFIGVGSLHDKHAAYEAGADDYLITPPDIIELRQRVRLHMDRAALEARLVAETRITQEMETLSEEDDTSSVPPPETLTLLEHVAELTREHELYAMILRSAGCPIALIAPEGTPYYVNTAWEHYFGSPSALVETLGWPPRTDSSEADRALHKAIAQNSTWQGSARLQTQNKEWVETYMALTPVVGAAGELYGYTLVLMDISAEKMPRTVRAGLIAEAVTELRSPLSNLKTRHYLLRTAPPEQRETHLQALGEGIEHLTRVLERISELFHLDAGLARLTFGEVDLNQLAQGVAARYNARGTAHPVRVILYDGRPPISGDTTHLARALSMLLECMLVHSPTETQITLEVGVNLTAERPFATLQIRNSAFPLGPEVPLTRHLRDTLCQSRLSQSEPRISLAIAQEITRRHNGMLTAARGTDEQCALTLWLPFGKPENHDEQAV